MYAVFGARSWSVFQKKKKNALNLMRPKYTFEKFPQTVIKKVFGVQRVIATCLLENLFV